MHEEKLKLQFDDIHYSIWFLLFESNIQMCLKYYFLIICVSHKYININK